MHAIIRFTDGVEAKLLDDARTWECDDPVVKKILERSTIHVANCGPAVGPLPQHDNPFHELAEGVAQHVGADLILVEEPETFEFTIRVESPLSKPDFIVFVKSIFPNRTGEGSWYFDCEGSAFEIERNLIANSEKVKELGDGYMYMHMRYMIHCGPAEKRVTEEHQVTMARRIFAQMESSGYRALIRAPFADKFPSHLRALFREPTGIKGPITKIVRTPPT